MFPPTVHVGGTFTVGYRCAYAGEFLVLSTAAGSVLTVTPGHPLATPEGFVPACEVGAGRRILRWTSAIVTANPNARDAYFALHAGSHQQHRALAATELHGDAGRVVGDLSFVQPCRSPFREGHGHESDVRAGHVLGTDIDLDRAFVERLMVSGRATWDDVSGVTGIPADSDGVGAYGFHAWNGWMTAEQLVMAG